jgi:hypothetical protein
MGGSSGGRSWDSLGDIKSLEQKAKAALERGKKNVFISFAYEDVDEVNALRAQAKNDKSDIEFSDRSVHEPYDSERADYIRSRLTDRINQASVTVVYLSDETAASKWVKWEVDKSLELGKRVIAMHPEGGRPSSMPSWIKEHKIKVVLWRDLANELKR